MTISITSTVIRHDGRVAGQAGLVIGDYTYADGLHERCTFTAANGQDAMVHLQAQIVARENGRRDAEIRRNISEIMNLGKLATPKFVASSIAENAAALREEFRDAVRMESVMIGDYLHDLTNNQIANAFDISLAAVAILRTEKLIPARTAADNIRASTGA
jgi:hypothetical protein